MEIKLAFLGKPAILFDNARENETETGHIRLSTH